VTTEMFLQPGKRGHVRSFSQSSKRPQSDATCEMIECRSGGSNPHSGYFWSSTRVETGKPKLRWCDKRREGLREQPRAGFHMALAPLHLLFRGGYVGKARELLKGAALDEENLRSP
jgi:hypothetical protein